MALGCYGAGERVKRRLLGLRGLISLGGGKEGGFTKKKKQL